MILQLQWQKQEDSFIRSTSHIIDDTKEANSSRTMVLKAQQLLLLLRRIIEEEPRQKLIREMGQDVAQAEVMEDDGSQTRRRVLLCSTGIMVIVLFSWQLLLQVYLLLGRGITVQI
jgi:hypothetical protein